MRRSLTALLVRLRAMAYAAAPEAAGQRDLRIDLLRGFCVFVMIVDHVGGESSWLYLLTGGNRFFVSAAEGFVLLSGLSMGMVHANTIRRHGVRTMLARVAGRARYLYALTVALTILFAAVSTAFATPYAAAMTPATSATQFAIEVITFHRSYSLTDVLVLYTLLVLAAGPALWAMSRGFTWLALALSFAAWTLAQVSLDLVPRAWSIVDGGFPFSAWQLLFFLGLAIGYHRRRVEPFLRPSRLVAMGLAALVALVVVNLVASRYVAGWIGADVWDLLFDKNDARIGRVLALAGAASLLYATATVAWAPLRRWAGWLLLPLGQRSLFAYGVQLFVVAFWSSELMAPVRLDRENALFQGAAVLMVWAATVAQPAVLALWRAARSWRPAVAPRAASARATLALAFVFLAAGCGASGAAAPAAASAPAATAVPSDTWRPEAVAAAEDPGPGRVEQGVFYSAALKRTMSYLIYLPPAYEASTATRFPTLYMLHGGSGLDTEWVDYGLLSAADALMRDGTVDPFIIVLPQGDQEYWVDHVVDASTGANGETWGTYTAKEVVPTIDARYRTIANAGERAIGGLSMGGHGAMQLALNFPGIWSIVGAHSPSLRAEGDAPTYLGKGAAFAARDPLALIAAKPDLARTITWWIDAGDLDPWRAQARAIGDELTGLGIANAWHPYAGDHSAAYWGAHVSDYLGFYGSAFASRARS
ncbi:MAG TPA: OpgC domain-containing protein [Candidatus Limnocylindria bacterium]|nr:OpgC domain-containing protein [Candidatus Limnocylindria bacterium]